MCINGIFKLIASVQLRDKCVTKPNCSYPDMITKPNTRSKYLVKNEVIKRV